MSGLEFIQGIAYWNGKPLFLVTAEYPYFRDAAHLWESRLRVLRDLGVRIISTYIPWRHHEIEINGVRTYDFTGKTQSNRNVVGFLDLCRKLDLWVLAKPGPFCHGELNYGGLPDFVCPLVRPEIEPVRSSDGTPVTWWGSLPDTDGQPQQWPLPSVYSEVFRQEAARWLQAVSKDVLRSACYPKGPVIAVQVGNEGIFSDAQHPVWKSDYSEPAVSAYRAWLQQQYASLDEYNQIHGTSVADWREILPPRGYTAPKDLHGLKKYMDWSQFLGHTLGQTYQQYAALLDLDVPTVSNVNPPLADPWGVDAWLSRVQPHLFGSVQYGYTNWIGIAAEDPSVMSRYMLLTRRAPGPNMEEDWGFATLYGPAYEYPSVCFQQTLLAIAGGATGYNLYTAVGTAHWTDDLDRFQSRPYPSHPPVREDGSLTPKAMVAGHLGRFFAKHGADYLACRPATPVAWGLYVPYSLVGAWTGSVPREKAAVSGHQFPPTGPVMMAMDEGFRRHGIEMDFTDVERSSLDELLRYPVLVLPGMPFMDASTQEKLATYCRRGGRLAIIGEVPTLDNRFSPCHLLKAAGPASFSGVDEALTVLLTDVASHAIRITPAGSGYAWIRVHPSEDLHFVTVLTRDTDELTVRYAVGDRDYELSLGLAPRTGAVVRIERGKPVAALVKGTNELLGRTVKVWCRVNNHLLEEELLAIC